MEEQRIEDLKKKYENLDQSVIERTADIIVDKAEVERQRKLEEWEDAYLMRIKGEYEETENILEAFGVTADKYGLSQSKRIMLIMRRLFELEGFCKGVKEAV